jgi:hypothetical protein
MKIFNKYIPNVEVFECTNEFTYLAKTFETTGTYCNIPEESIQYREFWKDVKDKCINGMTNSKGIKISGNYFFYLNFCPILSQSEDEASKRKRKTFNFPKFVDLDYEYFWMIEYCKLNEKSLLAVKGRRQGWSYKGASISTHEYTFFKESRSIIGAFLGTYSQGTMNMVTGYLNHISTFTPFGHIRNPDLKDYFMSQHQKDIGGVKVWHGYKSSVESITFKDRPAVAAGKSASVLILDEAGLFPNITESWGFTEPLIKDGSSYTGIAIIYGSAGDMDSGSKYFYDMFINPRKYTMLEFEDPDNPSKVIGFFSSATKGRWGTCKNPKSQWYKQPMVDAEGNSNEEAAYDDLMYMREMAKGGLDPRAIHLATTQFPITWQEAFLRNKGAIFSSPEMLEWLGELETTPSLRDQMEKGNLVWRDSKLEFQPSDELEYITSFPLLAEENSTGCIAIWERPEYTNGEIPHALYIAGCDPYDMDKSSVNSLGSFFIYKRFYQLGRTYDIIVAEYTGRPKSADEFYENCRRLCIYYNAKCLYENQLKGFKNYFLQKNSLQYLWEQPDHMIKDIIKDSKVQRGYGVHMTRGSGGSSGIKDMCELYTRDWLYTEKDDVDGNKRFNFHFIKSIPLLKELIAYDGETNTDRAIALMLCILQTKELHKIHADLMVNSSMSYGNDPFLKKLWNKNLTQNKFKFNN